jgi:hypothetical protein
MKAATNNLFAYKVGEDILSWQRRQVVKADASPLNASGLGLAEVYLGAKA